MTLPQGPPCCSIRNQAILEVSALLVWVPELSVLLGEVWWEISWCVFRCKRFLICREKKKVLLHEQSEYNEAKQNPIS